MIMFIYSFICGIIIGLLVYDNRKLYNNRYKVGYDYGYACGRYDMIQEIKNEYNKIKNNYNEV